MRTKRPSATTVIALVALVVATSTGSAVGARLITGKQIRDNSITGADVKNKSLTPRDFRGSVRGPVGPPGPPGGGGGGGGGVGKLTRVEKKGTVDKGATGNVRADCPAGQVIVSGGFVTSGSGSVVTSDSLAAQAWTVGYDNVEGTKPAEVTAFAYCMPG